MRIVLISAVFLAACASASAEPNDRRFLSGIAGTSPASPADRADTYFKKREVRLLLARLEAHPLDRSQVEDVLAGSGTSIDDLLRTHILRTNSHGYAIGFTYLTLDDVRRIRASAARHVPLLVSAYIRERSNFAAIFSRYDVASVDKARLAYALIAGMGLNWDALRQTQEDGYRKPDLVTGPGWKYSFWAAEDDPGYSLKGYFWGSTSVFSRGRFNFADMPVDFNFSSFGDPGSDPRMNLPDILYLAPADLAPDIRMAVERIGTRDENFGGFELKNVLGVSRGRSLGAMLFALREGPKDLAALAFSLPKEDRGRIAELVELLIAIGYVGPDGQGRYEMLVPVLENRDAALVDAALSLHRNILRRWMQQNYPAIRRELSDLTPIKNGVPFESVFTQVWHEFFGLATRDLVMSGMLADPYAPWNVSKGSLGLVWRMSLYDFDPQ